jgi:GT2 family glycosyltransferase
MSPQHKILSRAHYQVRYNLQRIHRPPAQPGVSVLITTWNRAKFFAETLRTLEATVPEAHEILIWNNASHDETADVINAFQSSRLNLRVFNSKVNIGTSGYASLALHAAREWLIALDDDVLRLPEGWFDKMTAAFHAFPDLGYLALDVVQDRFTTGNKFPPDAYQAETRDGIIVEFGATGAWATMTPSDFYFHCGGLPFRPHKLNFIQDGFYQRNVRENGRCSGILKDVKVYHATGAKWAAAYGYLALMREKFTSYGSAPIEESAYEVDHADLPNLSVVDVAMKPHA